MVLLEEKLLKYCLSFSAKNGLLILVSRFGGEWGWYYRPTVFWMALGRLERAGEVKRDTGEMKRARGGQNKA